jgi:hypothetical protein
MKTFLSVNVNGIGRITDKTPKDIIGIGTHGLKTCIGVFLYNDKRISLLHLDYLSNLDAILEEAKYFDKEYKLAIVFKDETPRSVELILFIGEHFPPNMITRVFKTDNGTTYLDREGNFGPEVNFPAGASVTHTYTYIPDSLLRVSISFINIFLTYKDRNCVLEYDGEKYLPVEELCKAGQELLENIRTKFKEQNLVENYDNIEKYLHSIALSVPLGKKPSAVGKLAAAMNVVLDHVVPSYFNGPAMFSINGLDVKISYDKHGESYARHLVDTINPSSYKHESKPDANLIPKLPYLNTLSKTVVLPMFWLRQLPSPALNELEENFGVTALARAFK